MFVVGSQTLVKALVERCIAKEKVPLCCFTPRNGAITKYVCLIPSAGDEKVPFGFHIIPLPSYSKFILYIYCNSFTTLVSIFMCFVQNVVEVSLVESLITSKRFQLLNNETKIFC